MRKTKIVCTVGPSTDSEEVLEQLMLAGMNVARFNFSHADFKTHKTRFDQIVKIREKLNLPIATMLDTKGPEVRLGIFKDNKKVKLNKGDEYILTTDECECDETKACVSFPRLANDVKIGTKILIDDGLVSMTVDKICDHDIHCTVVDGGKCKMYYKNFGEFYLDQIKEASVIVISKTEKLSEEKLISDTNIYLNLDQLIKQMACEC